MAAELTDKQKVEIYHTFDTWRQITNFIIQDQGYTQHIHQELKVKADVYPNREFLNLVDVVNFVYTSTQDRLRRILIKSIGMS